LGFHIPRPLLLSKAGARGSVVQMSSRQMSFSMDVKKGQARAATSCAAMLIQSHVKGLLSKTSAGPNGIPKRSLTLFKLADVKQMRVYGRCTAQSQETSHQAVSE
jgi:hypothetical protein